MFNDEEIRALLASATPGWRDDNGYRIYAKDGDALICETKHSDASAADHALIAAAPTLAAELLAAREVVRRLVERLEEMSAHNNYSCEKNRHREECTCGLDALLASARAITEGKP